MPAIKEARGFLYSLVIIGTLVLIASLYSTVWATPSQGVNAVGTAGTVPNAATAAAAAANDAATASASAATAAAEAEASAASAEATAAALPAVTVQAPTGGAVEAFAPGSVSTLAAPDGKVMVTIPASAPTGSFFLVYEPQAQTVAPAAPPEGLTFGTSLFDLSVVDLAGDPVPGAGFNSLITITVAYSDTDLQAAHGNPSRLKIYKYDTVLNAWMSLATTLDTVTKTVQTNVSRLSFFALMGQEPPPTPTPTPKATLGPGQATDVPLPTATLLLPTPGDVAPGSGLLIGLLIAAFILIAAGSYYLRQSKQS